MNKIILHIPHSSSVIPLNNGYVVDEKQLAEEILLLTDWYTDDLFSHNLSIAVNAGFSRLFCDVERFADDTLEVMSSVGMGVLYEKRDDGSQLRIITPDLRSTIIEKFYDPHHKNFTDAVESQLALYGKAVILDCHSFPDVPLKRDLVQNNSRPDYNIGTDGFHSSDKLLRIAQEFFSARSLSLGLNTPYAGSIVPLKYYQKNKNVQSIMLEINRRLYLENGTNNKTSNYSKVKDTVGDFIKSVYESCLLS